MANLMVGEILLIETERRRVEIGLRANMQARKDGNNFHEGCAGNKRYHWRDGLQ